MDWHNGPLGMDAQKPHTPAPSDFTLCLWLWDLLTHCASGLCMVDAFNNPSPRSFIESQSTFRFCHALLFWFISSADSLGYSGSHNQDEPDFVHFQALFLTSGFPGGNRCSCFRLLWITAVEFWLPVLWPMLLTLLYHESRSSITTRVSPSLGSLPACVLTSTCLTHFALSSLWLFAECLPHASEYFPSLSFLSPHRFSLKLENLPSPPHDAYS